MCLLPRDTRVLLTIKQMWQIDRVHGLPGVAAPVFFPSVSRVDERWWGTGDSISVYLWDTMEDQDRQDSLEVLRDKDNWVIWKTKDDKWTHELRQSDFHQLLTLDKHQSG
jgi:hypothetical protein